MKTMIKCNGELVTINGHQMHIYRQGNKNAPAIVFMSGHCTVAPVYDFKVLYEKLSNDFKIIVIEKFGYGYSDIVDCPCDIDSLVTMQKDALNTIGETGPYILAPHSMAGIETIRWKQMYPNDVSAIIGLDMATPSVYKSWTEKELAKRIIEKNPNKEEYVCAAGISPSGSIHIGNFRDVATSYFVYKALYPRYNPFVKAYEFLYTLYRRD